MTTRIKSGLGGYVGCSFLFGTIFTLVGAGATWATWDREDTPGWVRGMLGLFSLVGAAGLIMGVANTARMRKYGEVFLDLDRAVIGGELVGVVEAGFAAPSGATGTLTLSCSKTVESSRGRKNSASHTTSLHRQTVPIDIGTLSTTNGRTRIPVRLDIPAGLPMPGRSHEAGRTVDIDWELLCHVSTPGLDLVAPFRIPVTAA